MRETFLDETKIKLNQSDVLSEPPWASTAPQVKPPMPEPIIMTFPFALLLVILNFEIYFFHIRKH